MDNKQTGKIVAVVPTKVEFSSEKELLDYFGIEDIEIQPVDNAWVGARALVYYKGSVRPVTVTLFIDDDGKLRGPRGTGIDIPIDRGTQWTNPRNGQTVVLHNQFLNKAIVELIEKKANAQISARPDLAKKQQSLRAQRAANSKQSSNNASSSDVESPFGTK